MERRWFLICVATTAAGLVWNVLASVWRARQLVLLIRNRPVPEPGLRDVATIRAGVVIELVPGSPGALGSTATLG